MNDIYKQKRWVVWNLETVGGRQTKVPYSINGRKASSTDEDTWCTYEEAKKASEFFSGIGVVFTPDQTLLGIDIDHVLNDQGKLEHEDPEVVKRIKRLLRDANTYTEVSPSGHGLHLYFALTSSLKLEANRHAPFEAYTSGRYFTFTEMSYDKRKKPIREIKPETAVSLLNLIWYPWNANKTEPLTVAATDHPLKAAHAAPGLLDGPIVDDATLLELMFASKNGDKIQALYENKSEVTDLSRADSALLAHLAFWTRKDAAQMERLWLNSPLGARKKTQERKDYRDRSIGNAIAKCKETFTSSSERNPVENLDLLYTFNSHKDKVYTQNTENMARILRRHEEFKGTLRFDTFTDRMEIKDPMEGVWRSVEDHDVIYLQTRISTIFTSFQKVGKDMVYDAMIHVAKDNKMDSAIDFVKGLEWDGKARLDDWLHYTFGTPQDEYHRAVGSNWIKGLVKRITIPGCKFDYVLVLEGAQGSKKSTSLFILGQINDTQNWHVETTMSTESKDFFEQFQGKAIIEFSEGETLSRTEVKRMKAIITTQVDRFRPSYGRISVDHPRRCVFAMTTNQEQYLKDETGNRRWLPVRVELPEANVEWLKENRDQLFAEAYHRLTVKKETIYEFPKEATAREQELRRISSPNQEKICDWYLNELKDDDRAHGVTIEQAYSMALNHGFGGPVKKYEEMEIADTFATVLKLVKRRKMRDGVQRIRWFDPRYVESPLDERFAEEGITVSERQSDGMDAFNAADEAMQD